MNSNNKTLSYIIIGIVLIWALSGVLTMIYLDEWSDRGTFGDLFGAINSLFSGLALAGLIYSIYGSRQEIQLQREEIELNRKELIKSRKTQEKSEKSLEAQVVQMRIASKLSGINTLITYYSGVISNQEKPEDVREKAREQRRALIKEIDDLIDRLGDEELE
ncbi:hypothetical protein N9W02_03350 [Flavobacteriaceae bacterium]|nr:hypothetical protein [Flavobacteriaceae bacterium]